MLKGAEKKISAYNAFRRSATGPEATCQELSIQLNTKFKVFAELNHHETPIPQEFGAAKGILKVFKPQKKKTNLTASDIPWKR